MSFHHASRRDSPSTDTARVTTRKISFKPTNRRSSHASPNQTCPPGTVRVTDPTASRKASAQVAQVFGTHSYGRGRRSVQRSDGPVSQIRCRPLCWSGFRTTCQPAGSCRGVAHKRCDADRSVIRHARCGPIWREVRKGAGRGGTLSRNAPPGSCGSPPRGVSGVMAHTTFKARGGFPACAGAGASRLQILPIPSAVQASSPGRRGGWPHSVFLRI